MELKNKIAVIQHLVKLGFLATESGYFVKVQKGEPIVIFWDFSKAEPGWVIDRPGYTSTFTTIAEMEAKAFMPVNKLAEPLTIN